MDQAISPERASVMETKVFRLPDLIASPEIWYRLHVLLFDLQHFSDRSDSRERLDKVVDPSYIGFPHFNSQEASMIESTLVRDERSLSQVIENELNQRLNRRLKKRVESSDYRVCAAHALAPVISSSLGIDLKRLEKDRNFARLLDTKGLELGDEVWNGLTTKSFAVKRGKRKKEH